jgi:hypothetical protein
MSVKFKNIGDIEARLKKQLYQKMASVVPQLATRAREELRKTYFGEFGRDPVDTGQARDDSRAVVEIRGRNSQGQDAPTINVTLKIEGKAENYAIYFLEPLQPKNSNFKYGKRNTLTRARDNLMTSLGIK